MYIGRLGNGTHPDDGIYVLLKEIIDNAVDEFTMKHGNRIEVTILNDSVSVRDYGRGIPLGKVVECVSVINTGAKYDSEAFQFSVGLNGVGTKAVNALSSEFLVRSYREGKFVEATFKGGKLDKKKEGKTKEPDGTFVSFHPDPALFPDFHYHDDIVTDRLWSYAYLNTGLTIEYNKTIIKSSHGLLDLLSKVLGDDGLYPTIHFKNEHLEFAFTHTSGYGENYFSYVNGQNTSDGGTHLAAFKEGILKGINEFFRKSWQAPEIRDGIVAAVAIKMQNPVFESQTKNKLGSTEVRAWIVNEVKEAVLEALLKNKEIAQGLQDKVTTNEKVHKEEQEVRNNSKERAKKTAIHIPKLKDCRYHIDNAPAAHRKDAESSMIFLTEGDSAAGTISKVRNPDTQAVFALRGKPFNVQGYKRTELYKHEELYNIMVALGIENGIDDLRYSKVVIATDADTDGFHIRILLMTFFLTYFEELVTSGKLFILETPLFKVRNKSITEFCYTESERDDAIRRIRGCEVTRFKGLGEIDAPDFKNFIGDDIKLLPVTIASLKDIKDKMEFYMGDNTPQRREFIMENLLNVTG